MRTTLKLTLLVLPLLCGLLGGCVVYEDGGYYHRHYWHDRY